MLPKEPNRKHQQFESVHIVAIGASAGGLEAIQSLLNHLPELANTCFIVAQHLSPKHKSMLVQLLSKGTSFIVEEAVNNAKLEAGYVYITPPDEEITVKKGKIRLKKPTSSIGPKPSIDVLFNSLAKEPDIKVVGVVLSGTGSDGAAGIKALRKKGHFIISQEPETAKYDGMPVAAIQTGVVDVVLAPEKIGEEIQDYLSNSQKIRTFIDSDPSVKTTFNSVLTLLGKRTGTDFSNYKMATIERRLQKRISMLKMGSIEEYLKYMERNPQEIDELFKMILIGVTTFFRDFEAFAALEDTLRKQLHTKSSKDTIRVWVPGCSTGEEAYSIAILLHRILKNRFDELNIQVFATDIDERAVRFARNGIYSQTAVESMPKEIIDEYFTKSGDDFELIKPIRAVVLFSKHDLTRNPPFLNLDLISSRNLLIYFNSTLQGQIIPIFHYALNHEGHLFLGKSESVGHFGNLFSLIDSKNKLYRRKRVTGNYALKFSAFRSQGKATTKLTTSPELKKPSLTDIVRDTLYTTFDHPYVVVDSNYEIKQVHGDVRLFMTLSSGMMQADLLKMLNPELQIEVRSILTKAIRDRINFRSSIRRFELFGSLYFVRVHVKFLQSTNLLEDHFMVIFENLDIAEYLAKGQVGASDAVSAQRMLELEQELASTKEHLQTYIEEIETSNEELQSLNEEMQSTNEELQSSNEELETSNEELQSTNEEIQIAYTELRTALEELELKERLLKLTAASTDSLLNNDLQAFVLLDPAYKLDRFNLKAELTFSEFSGKKLELGRSVVDYLPSGHAEDFLMGIRRSMEGTSLRIEKELIGKDGQKRWYAINYAPSKIVEGPITGVTIGILDITDLRIALTELSAKDLLVRTVFETVPTGICITDQNGSFIDMNEEFCHITGYTKDELYNAGSSVLSLPFSPASYPAGKDDRTKKSSIHTNDYMLHRKDGTTVVVSMSNKSLEQIDGSVYTISSLSDITQKHEFDASLKELYNQLDQQAKSLANSNAELQQFAYTASHDLQEPLRMITSFMTLLQSRYANSLDAKANEYIHFAVDGARRMRKIILDLLDYSRAGKSSENIESINLNLIVDDVLKLQSQMIKEKDAVIDVNELPTVMSFHAPVTQIFSNLIGNALKYSAEGRNPHIVVDAKKMDLFWEISVADNGIGISPDNYDKIFMLFQRANNSPNIQGTGMGLAIVKKIVESLGGLVRVESKVDSGSTFYFTLPITR